MCDTLPYDDFIFKDNNLNLNEPGFYYISVEYYNSMPILPIKTDKLYFKEGRISGWYWHEEILLLLKYTKTNNFELVYGLVSLKNEKILFDFLNILNQFKDTDSIKKKIGKLLINSFYGRLALNEEMFFIELLEDLGLNKNYGIINNFYIIKKKILKKTTKSNIALAAAIASKARIKLYEAQQEVIQHGGRLLYSDTDSIFAAFNKNLNIENKLLNKYVIFDTNKYDTEIKDAVFISSKSYALKFYNDSELIKLKGINLIDIEFNTLKDRFFSGELSIPLKNQIFSKKNLSLEHFNLSKNLNLQNYNKRLWVDNKLNTKPLIN